MKVHICLISDQLLANFLPLKLERPDKVFIIDTQYTKKKGLSERFEILSQGLGVETVRAQKLAPDDDFTQLHEYFLHLSEEIKLLQADELTLNLTGGTKLMALAAYEMLKKKCHRVIYTNTGKGKVDELNEHKTVELPGLLTIEEYLISYGVSPKNYNNKSAQWLEKINQRKTLTEMLADFFAGKGNHLLLGDLNYTVNKAIEKRNSATGGWEEYLAKPTQKMKKINNENHRKLLQEIQAAGLIDYDGHETITLKSIDAARYLGGFWLEEHVYFVAHDVGVDEVRCGQSIQWEKKARNELDIVIIHNNRLLIIECKTAKFGERQKDDQIIYKLDSIAEDLRGLYGRKWLISVRGVNDRNTLNRARSQGVEVISGGEIRNLKKMISNWKNDK